MKTVYSLLVIVFGLLTLSCSKTSQKDPADDLVGKYKYTDHYYLKWGGDSKNDTYQGTFSLTKIASNKVRMTGDWNTTGTITGNSIQFEFCPQSSSQGYVNYTFGAGIIGYTNMTFTYSCSGYMTYSNGISYPWDTSGNVYAWRISEEP